MDETTKIRVKIKHGHPTAQTRRGLMSLLRMKNINIFRLLDLQDGWAIVCQTWQDVQWKALVSPPSRPNKRQFRRLRNTHQPYRPFSPTLPALPQPQGKCRSLVVRERPYSIIFVVVFLAIILIDSKM